MKRNSNLKLTKMITFYIILFIVVSIIGGSTYYTMTEQTKGINTIKPSLPIDNTSEASFDKSSYGDVRGSRTFNMPTNTFDNFKWMKDDSSFEKNLRSETSKIIDRITGAKSKRDKSTEERPTTDEETLNRTNENAAEEKDEQAAEYNEEEAEEENEAADQDDQENHS